MVNIIQQYAPRQRYCNRVVLSQPIDVQEGDVIGVCLPDPIDIEPLDVYEEVGGYQLLHEITYEGYLPTCEDDDVKFYDTSSGWHTDTSRALNVNLEISESSVS